MAVLKSFELKGNKQSFASWISTLSPCDTPFTSMIGKEGIDQAQYSWQTDTLAPADNQTYEEGSQATFQTRATTKELTNFTSTLRKVVHITETAEAIATHGRGKEMAYQMSKAGKEIMRDLEWMNLSRVNGNPGSTTLASSFSGFEGLVAGMNVFDNDTGAVVHKEISISLNKNTCIDKDDIFDLTYNLYLAGSKANKIMFHPEHTTAFSMLIGANALEDNNYRMFEGLSSQFNAYVNRIRDPLGQVFELIPNRYMPVDKIYFFNEKDWTQMILRAPHTTLLCREGSSHRHLIEMEVGLRHSHPFASGILSAKRVTITNDFNPGRKDFTAHVNDALAVRGDVLVDGVAEPGLVVSFHSSDPEIITFQNDTVSTNSQGRAVNQLRAGNKTGQAKVWTVCRGVKSKDVLITVHSPLMELTSDKTDASKGEQITFTATVKKFDGGALGASGAGISVEWYSEPDTNLKLESETTPTVSGGVASVKGTVVREAASVVQAVLKEALSNIIIVNYAPAPGKIEGPVINPDTFSVGDKSEVSVTVLDHFHRPLPNAEVTWSVQDGTAAELSSLKTTSDANGIAKVTLTGLKEGTTTVKGVSGAMSSLSGEFTIMPVNLSPIYVSMDSITVGDTVKLGVVVRDYKMQELPGVIVHWSSNIDPTQGAIPATSVTDGSGSTEVEFTPLSNSDFVITARVGDTESQTTLIVN